jgi:ferredoxin-NADP reductase
VGSKIKLCGGPMGKFTCATNPSPKILMISAGSGITPMLSMARWFYDTAAPCDLVFFHSARSQSDLIMRQELELMAARQPNFRLAVTLTRPELGQPWMGFTGRLTERMLANVAPDFRDRVVYVCGPNRFMQDVKTLFSSLGFPMENYYEESFGVEKKLLQEVKPEVQTPAVQASTPAKPVLVFAGSSKEVPCDEEESILNVAQQHGIKIRAGCMQGVCGACKTRKLAGQVKYQTEPDALDKNEKEQGYILPCVAFPVGKVTIEA